MITKDDFLAALTSQSEVPRLLTELGLTQEGLCEVLELGNDVWGGFVNMETFVLDCMKKMCARTNGNGNVVVSRKIKNLSPKRSPSIESDQSTSASCDLEISSASSTASDE